MDLKQLQTALQKSWSHETAYGGIWSKANPALGQCAISSLIVQDYFGGKIERFFINDTRETHYANNIHGAQIDTTISQFDNGIKLTLAQVELADGETMRARMLANADTLRRYDLLRQKVEENL